MTALVERPVEPVVITELDGVYVRITSCVPAATIYVSNAEIDRALKAGRNPGRARSHVAHNIALGKHAGVYREWPKKDDDNAE